MKFLIDGNIILDVLQKREPHYSDSAKIWKMCETDIAEGCVSALTFANLVYVMRKELDEDKISEIHKNLSLIFDFVDMNVSDIAAAADMKWDDFEDAVQAATAKRIHADYIITRNAKDFPQDGIPVLSPTAFLNLK